MPQPTYQFIMSQSLMERPPVLRIARRSLPRIARIARINADSARVYPCAPCNPWFALLWLRWVALDSSASCLSHAALAIRQKKEHEHRSIDDGKRFEQQGTIRRHPIISDKPRVAKF